MNDLDAAAKPVERWRTVAQLLGQYRVHVVLLVGSAFAVGVIEAAFLVAATRIGLAIANNLDVVELTRGITLSVNQALVVAALLIVIRLMVALLDLRVQMGLTYRVTTGLRKRLADAFLHASWSVQQAQPAGALQQVVVTFPNTAGGLLSALTAAGGAALSLAALMLVALVVDPAATLVVLTALIVLSAVLGPLRRRVLGRAQLAVNHQIAFANSVAEVGELGMEISAFGVRDAVGAQVEDVIDRNAASQRRLGLLSGAISPVYVSLAYGAVLASLATVTFFGASNLNSVGAVMLVMLRSLGYGQQLQNGSSAVSQINPFLAEVDKTMSTFRKSSVTWGHQRPERVTPIELVDVTFGYRPAQPVLRNVDLRIEPGEVVGLVGPSGAGKSTLVQLILGLRSPDRGVVRAGGHLLTELDPGTWSSAVAFVPQEANLVTGTVADNIRFFRGDITDEQLAEGARAAHIWDEIARLPQGLSTHLGERGQQLSGGQKQRLCIARALVAKPQLLILDEPTSALDGVSEAAIRDTLSELKGSTAVVVIAHRPTTLEVCDRILDLSHLGSGDVSDTSPEASVDVEPKGAATL